jgi:hypothetical protein
MSYTEESRKRTQSEQPMLHSDKAARRLAKGNHSPASVRFHTAAIIRG